MRKTLALLFIASVAFAHWLEIDKAHSDVKFVVKYLSISNINGYFNNYEAAIDFDDVAKMPKAIEVIVKADSIFTKNEKRDQNLTSEMFFDTQKFKSITFKMTSASEGRIYGVLKIKNVSKNMIFDYVYNGYAKNANGVIMHSFTLKTVLKRSEFNIAKGYPLGFIGDDVWVSIDVVGSLREKTPDSKNVASHLWGF